MQHLVKAILLSSILMLAIQPLRKKTKRVD
jgi:hypothetical protein